MDNLRDEQAKVSTASLAVLATVAFAGVLFVTRSIMVPFVLAIFIASVVSPLLDVQVLRFKLPRAVSVTSTLVVVLLVLGLFALLVAFAGQQMVAKAGEYAENLKQLDDPIQTQLDAWNLKWDFSKFWSEQTDKLFSELQAELPGIVTRSFGRTVSLFGSIMLVSIFLVFLLAGRNPHGIRQGVFAEMDQKIRGYIATKVLLSTATGVLVWIILAILGLDLALVFGLLAFLLNFIPSIGSVIATLLPIPIAVAQFGGDFWRIVAVVAIPGAIQMGIGNGLEPKLMGKELKLHPIAILLALSFWGLLWGMVGMLLAVPIMAVLRIVLLRFETTRPIGDLLAGELSGNEAASVLHREEETAS